MESSAAAGAQRESGCGTAATFHFLLGRKSSKNTRPKTLCGSISERPSKTAASSAAAATTRSDQHVHPSPSRSNQLGVISWVRRPNDSVHLFNSEILRNEFL